MRGGSTAAMFTRALRSDTRRLRPHLFRMLFAGLILGSLVMAHIQSLSLGAPGLFFFGNILWLNLVLIVLAAVSFLSTAITEEKEEGTLGLLMLAGVSPLAMLLGKSSTRLFSTALLLVVQFPFALMAIVLGGVTLTQIVAGYIALAAFLALSANVGLLTSVICRRSGNAGGLTLLVLVVALGGGYVLRPLVALLAVAEVRLLGLERQVSTVPLDWYRGSSAWFDDVSKTLPWVSVVAGWLDDYDQLSMVTRLELIGGRGFSESLISRGVVWDLVVSIVLFGIAWWIFVPATRNSLTGVPPRGPVTASSVSRRRGWLRWLSRPSWLAAGRTWRMAISWKEFHFTTGGVAWLLLKTVVYGVFLGLSGWLLFDPVDGMPLRAWARMVLLGLLCCIGIEGGVYASRVFHDERKYRTLGVTLGFPIPAWRIVLEKLAGCSLGLLPAVGWLLIGIQIDELVFLDLIVDYRTWIAGLVYLVLVHLVLLLSLYVRWGALPLAVAVLVIVGGCGYPMIALPTAALGVVTGSDRAMVMPSIYACSVGVAVLLGLIVLRLKAVASES